MKNRNFKRNIFGDLRTQRWAQEALPILISSAQKGDPVIMRDLAGVVAPHLTQFNFAMGKVLAWIHTTLWELERSDNWNYGEIPGITALVLDKPEKPTKWADKDTRVDPNRPLPWNAYEMEHLLLVFKYPHWDQVMEYIYSRNEILANGEVPGPQKSGNSEDY